MLNRDVIKCLGKQNILGEMTPISSTAKDHKDAKY